MPISDAVVGNITTIYLLLIATTKAYALSTGRSFSPVRVIFLSTAVVGSVLIASLAWDVSRKAAQTHTKAASGGRRGACRGGICWHGVAEKSPVSQVRFRLPQHH